MRLGLVKILIGILIQVIKIFGFATPEICVKPEIPERFLLSESLFKKTINFVLF
jgi:hypothetical protein